ncbi:MAG: SMP-30/gluconolactonase/LRE family protein, partial [Gemmatimonadetes bacterium]|nr:SMP-30/gluconolactonase/LRE family protein [Gemmatimonadota bacterium]
ARFRRLIRTSARLDHLYEGCRWAEGPAYVPAWRHLVWSDVPNDRMMRWDEVTGAVSVFRSPSHYSNGNTIDREGRLITCEHGTRRVTRLEHDGRITVLADTFEGKRFNSPNDVVVKSDGTIWFTDPSYGIDSNYEGYRAASEIGSCNVYRLDPATGSLIVVSNDFVQPNGLAFSPDERLLYIADSGVSHVPGHPRHIRVFEVTDDGRLGSGSVFAETTDGVFDGFRVDEDGHVWAGATSGVHCYTPEGELLGIIRTPERVANVAFGGLRRNRLFIAGTTSLYAMLLPVSGAKTF